jgi:hypothetical protein
MKLFHFRWISDQLTEQLRASRIQKYQELLPLLERIEEHKFRNILTDDKSWFMLGYQHAVKWSLSHEDVSERVRQQIGTKVMLTVIWGVDDFHVVDQMTLQRSFDSEYSVTHVLALMFAKAIPRGGFHILVDYNFTWITAKSTFQKPLSNLSLKTILDVRLTNFTILILHHRTSGFSIM